MTTGPLFTRATTALLLMASSLQLTACCCPCTDGCDTGACDPGGCDPGGCDPGACAPDVAPVAAGPEVDLGIAPYPPSTPTQSAVDHNWIARELTPPRYHLGYALSGEEAHSVRADHLAFARKLGYHPVDEDRFYWTPSPRCQGDMRCIFEELGRRNAEDIKVLAARFRARVQQANLSALDAAVLVVTFVQKIRYEIPKSEPFGILPPALVVAEKRGDCDSKAFLGQMLLHELGIESMLISSEAHKHTMLGIALPVQGKNFVFEGTRYAFAECTAENSPIGHINPGLLHPNDWRAVPVPVK